MPGASLCGAWPALFCFLWRRCTWPVFFILASPRSLLMLQRLQLCEAAMAMTLMCLQLLVFLSFPGTDWDPGKVHVLLLLFFTVFPIFVTMLRLPVLVGMERRSKHLVFAFEREERRVDAGFIQLLRGQAGRDMRLLSGLLLLWYAFSLLWEYAAPPCRDISMRAMPSLPCETLAFSCTVLFNVNALLFVCANVAPSVVHRFRERFVPRKQRGIPVSMLDRLPAFTFGTEGAPSMMSECYICLEDFAPGERIRHLPCGHHFHAHCVDDWLQRMPCCPMRCHNDVWEAMKQHPLAPPQHASPSTVIDVEAAAEVPRPVIEGRRVSLQTDDMLAASPDLPDIAVPTPDWDFASSLGDADVERPPAPSTCVPLAEEEEDRCGPSTKNLRRVRESL